MIGESSLTFSAPAGSPGFSTGEGCRWSNTYPFYNVGVWGMVVFRFPRSASSVRFFHPVMFVSLLVPRLCEDGVDQVAGLRKGAGARVVHE